MFNRSVFLLFALSLFCAPVRATEESVNCAPDYGTLSGENPREELASISLGDHTAGLLFSILQQHGLAKGERPTGKGNGRGSIPEQVKQLDAAVAASSEKLHAIRSQVSVEFSGRGKLDIEKLVNSDFASIPGFEKIVDLSKAETANPLLREKYDSQIYRYQQGNQWISIRLNYKEGSLEHVEVLVSKNSGQTWLPYYFEKEGEVLVSKRKVTIARESHHGENDVARQCANCHGGFGNSFFGPLVKFSRVRPASEKFLPFSRLFSTRPLTVSPRQNASQGSGE